MFERLKESKNTNEKINGGQAVIVKSLELGNYKRELKFNLMSQLNIITFKRGMSISFKNGWND